MDPITIGLLAGTAMGLGKGFLDKENEDRQRKLAAETARWSPWTGMSPQLPQSANVLGSTLQGAGTGAMFGQGLKNAGYLTETKDVAEAAAASDALSPSAPYQTEDAYAALAPQPQPGIQPLQPTWALMQPAGPVNPIGPMTPEQWLALQEQQNSMAAH